MFTYLRYRKKVPVLPGCVTVSKKGIIPYSCRHTFRFPFFREEKAALFSIFRTKKYSDLLIIKQF